MSEEISWIGLKLQNYEIEELLGSGSYSWVYKAVDRSNNHTRAVKTAKPLDVIAQQDVESSPFATQAIAQFTGSLGVITPDAAQLLKLQFEKLAGIVQDNLVSVEGLSSQPGMSYFFMPLIKGSTLRSVMDKGRASLELFVNVARAIDRVTAEPAFAYHGDLKPENIMVTESGITLIDPGYFGRVGTDRGAVEPVAVTTPIYYPELQPDDLLAFGLMLWEACTGKHPLLGRSNSQSEKGLGPDLRMYIRSLEVTGKRFMSPLRELQMPSGVDPGVSADLEKLLLKAIRLERLSNGDLERADGFRSFSALSGALIALKLKGVDRVGPTSQSGLL